MRRPKRVTLGALFGLGMLLIAVYLIARVEDLAGTRGRQFIQWARGDEEERADLVTIQREQCPGAPFVLPADGFIGLLYNDPNGPYSTTAPHQGIDIFSNSDPGVTPVYAAYGGYITREDDWRSTLIQRVPNDPLNPGNQIWLYYTHMADEAGNDFIVDMFPPGTRDLYVEQGTLLGYTGNFNGNSLRDVWVHLHFSIVKDNGSGQYLNELEFTNTIDPSPYLGLPVTYACAVQPIQCQMDVHCSVQ